ncbi:MAG: Hsp20/alpha crystallin family protein [Eubacteriales bacterium]|nr:Hsp20/alpha crystallin family protein [Eubacteriales bacterium]
MLMPSIFNDNFFDDFFRFPEEGYKRSYNTNSGLMQTDVTESDTGYEVKMNLPGFKKEDVKGELKDGYLVITASTNENNDQKDKDGKYIRRERYSGTCSRSFYVGENITQEDIKAKYDNGVLTIAIPKKEAVPKVDESKFIAIEG